ncbi:ufm1-specific protease 2 isoform X2 [Carcharodon carcharias]|uniref:ufm1-specific protease 2 isoform X2 n=1 Tax=Carcharodon carcharias TaxID=13397 RepID=UPI001B7DA7E2|nr:ufm1-specific protease 2 isoform X2 [Carcharodon carcharias]
MVPLDTEDLVFRIRGGIQLNGILSKTDENGIKNGFSEAMKDLIKKVNSQAFVLFGWESTLYVWPKSGFSTQPEELQENSTCKSILKLVPIEVNDYLGKISKRKSVKIEPLKVINLELLFELTRPEVIETVTVQNNNKSRIHFKLILPVDVVVFANPEDQWKELQNKIVEAVSEQLLEMDQCIQRYTRGKSVPIPQAFHFELPETTTLTTVIYPAGFSDKVLEPQRKELHDKLGLGNKPLLRRPMAYNFPNDDLMNKHLRTVHKYIPLPNPEEFKVYVVHGSYTFHHYLQDNINDSGWGCAYRSLQTIISWFNYQGYINVPIPSHEKIQQMLVSAGDKGPSIIGSTDWIGSFEIRSVLNLLGITSKLMSIRAGSEFVSSARELVDHFEVQGAPVMVGGEPLAHTLLGVAWNEETGAAKFLVLDAHYTGVDDWASVVERAVEWKGEEFWDQMEPYNICLPQRPEGV